MTLKFEDNELELVYSFRSSIYFEQITGHALDFDHFTSNDLMTLFYCVVIASLQKIKKPIVDMLAFMDMIDENGGDKCVYNFSQWYINAVKAQYEITDAELDKADKKKSKKNQ